MVLTLVQLSAVLPCGVWPNKIKKIENQNFEMRLLSEFWFKSYRSTFSRKVTSCSLKRHLLPWVICRIHCHPSKYLKLGRNFWKIRKPNLSSIYLVNMNNSFKIVGDASLSNPRYLIITYASNLKNSEHILQSLSSALLTHVLYGTSFQCKKLK